MSNTTKFASLFGALSQVIKQASEPETSHPVGNADDGNVPATESSHSAEITAELKDGLGAVAVPNAPDNPVEPEKLDMGTNVTASGDPPPEGKPKDKPRDSEMSPTDPEKIASVSDLVKLANAIGAGIKNLTEKPKVTQPVVTETPVKTPKDETNKDASEAKPDNTVDARHQQIITNFTKAATETADKVIDYLVGFSKAADEAMAANPDAAGDAAAMGGAAAGPDAGGQGGDPKSQALMLIIQIMQEAGLTPEELLSALGSASGGGAAPAAEPAPEAAAPPAEMTASASDEKFSVEDIKKAFELLNTIKVENKKS